MNYETVTLEEKTITGLSARTSNSDPNMNAVIGALWQRLFGEGIYAAIPGKVNEYSIGLYSDYSGHDPMTLEYDITIGREVKKGSALPEGTVKKVIPAGRYAKFSVHGDMVKAVCEAWQAVWSTPLDRLYTGDFEEYISAGENGECDVNIYIAVK